MSGTLFVVATPIGNLEDITLRALRVLREADVIAAEDTRRTARLLAHHAIATPTVSFHEHNTRARMPQLLARLKAGERVALVTDAGTPGVSDPGVELVAACIAAGIAVDPVPGASALLTAAAASGFPLVPFTFFGFPPHGAKDRTGWFEMVSGVRGTVCFFEAPHRILRTLDLAARYFGSRPIMVARELTKLHQEFLRGTSREVLAGLHQPRGEFTILVGPRENVPDLKEVDAPDTQLAVEFGHATEMMGLGRREAVSAIAKKHGRPAREVYAAIERVKSSGN
jgi:16S rRNA (cytidine1402-2'-O)-methyltransferase